MIQNIAFHFYTYIKSVYTDFNVHQCALVRSTAQICYKSQISNRVYKERAAFTSCRIEKVADRPQQCDAFFTPPS